MAVLITVGEHFAEAREHSRPPMVSGGVSHAPWMVTPSLHVRYSDKENPI